MSAPCNRRPSLTSGLHRQCLFGGLRIGLYEPVSVLTRVGRALTWWLLIEASSSFISLCFFLPPQVRNFYVGKDHKGDPPLHLKIAAGLTTGAVGISIASPTDLVKVERGRGGAAVWILSGTCVAAG